jgi:predicted O-methyltransferase YrrM
MIDNAQDFTVLQPLWKGIPGFFDFQAVYDEIAAGTKDGDVLVEVGCLLGRSACYLGDILKERGIKATLLCVDEWPALYGTGLKAQMECPFETFYANVRQAGLLDIVVPIRSKSARAAGFVKSNLDFVFIDASHEYEDVKSDIAVWLPKVRPGGIVAGHDFDGTFPGVVRAVTESFSGRFKIVGRSWMVHL